MKILVGNKWKGGFMDYHKSPKEYRIKVLAWKNLEELENVYHTRPKSLRLLWNYFPIVGPHGMFTKTWSRLREKYRNEKYTSCGIGKIIEEGKDGKFKKEEIVSFIAPLHPALVERVVLPKQFIFDLEESTKPELNENEILYKKEEDENKNWWNEIKGWSIYSGIKIDEEVQNNLEEDLKKTIENTDWDSSDKKSIKEDDEIVEVKGEVKENKSDSKTGVLFGYGNYAKINIIPYSKPHVDIKSVHEIDPTQIMLEKRADRWGTAPLPRKDENYDVYYVASYNHTHVPITLNALRQDAYAVVEKPVVMDYGELDELEKALRESDKGLFIGFHKRYGRFNKYAFEDLDVKKGEPINYHAIVYELIQPEFFWYNWPVSRSTFFANGCHQIDHFLYLNDFSKPRDWDLQLSKDNTIQVWIELENDAVFSMTFTEKGSSRVGPRDHVELKVKDRNVRITDSIKYQSETSKKKIRSKRIWKTEPYRLMYQEIGKKIANDERANSIDSILTSAKIMLDLEEKLQDLRGWGDRYKNAKEEFLNYF